MSNWPNILLDVLKAWENVPYFHCGSNKHGVDCANFIQLVLKDCGLANIIIEENIVSDWPRHTNQELLLANMNKFCSLNHLNKQSVKVPINGDLILMKNGTHVVNHLGIFYDQELWHCLPRKGVTHCPYQFYYQSRTVDIWRLLWD